MDKDVAAYVSSCLECQKNKTSTQRPAGLLQPLPIPERPWTSISMDFIVQLPKTSSSFDAITVFVDRLMKMIHLCPGKTTNSAAIVMQQFLDTIFKHHGLPRQIISDRDSHFTSHFWQALMKLLQIHLGMSTAFHPQTDGQTERANRTIEQVLRCYVDYRQKNWDSLLPLVEFSLNNHKSSSTGHSPFFLNFGLHPLLPAYHSQTCTNPAALTATQTLQANLTLAKDLLRRAQDRQRTYANQHRRDLTFDIGDLVLLDSSHVTPDHQRQRTSRKLAAQFVGPFPILARVGEVAYTLDLPDNMKIHPTFHVSLLKPYRDPSSFSVDRPAPSRPPPLVVDAEEEFEIDSIVDKRKHRSQIQYLVHWLGYDNTEDTWMNASDLPHAQELIDDFEDNLPLSAHVPFLEGGDV